MQEDPYLTEDSLRQALSRLGAGRERSSQQDSSEDISDTSSSMRHNSPVSRGSGQTFGRRRRFVGDDHVVVERPLQSRASQNRQANRASSSSHDHNEVKRLQQQLKHEQRRSREAEAEVDACKARITSLETRVAHFHMKAEERGNELQQHQEEVIRLKAELKKLRDAEKVPSRRRNSSKKASSTPPEPEDEPQPIQWWKD